MRTFSFRAEVRHDVTELIKKLPGKLNGVTTVTIRSTSIKGCAIPDVHIELIGEYTYQEVLAAMELVDDNHVMIETLRECPLVENSLVRSMNGGLA